MVTTISGDGQEPGAQEEKIFVAVRLRPMNEKEVAKNDNSDWECISKNTIIYKNGVTERSMYPNVYTFDRVYGGESTTKQVYEEGAKKTALSVLNGINSSIFAYGQTSSGKTYTMSGITKYAIRDLLDEISKQYDREFVVKFSAIEIYNECVRDLLSADGTPLRLLDDPEKGTVVDKLTEVKLIDWSHLMELLAVCEAQRQIGETSLNEMSSRSHQIIRLTVESTPIEFSGHHGASILTAIVNFVDLAGSERASQTLSAGARLKEGCHINRSLLTLGTVVRKLSKGRGGHVPYRDSKLTRILQNSLGGNAKTAIICTLSPAHTHLEQSRNTLLFATCAKEVRTNAQVNVVMSEKALVKQLQRELIRLENELKTIPATNDSSDVIKEKELQIEKMEREIKELQEERDQARTRLEEILRAAGIDERSIPRMDSNPIHQQKRSWDGHHASQSWMDPNPTLQHKSSWDALETSHIADPLHLDAPINANGFPRTRRFSAPPNPYTLPNKQSINAPIDTFLPDKKRSNALVNTYSFPDKHDPQVPDDDQYFFDNISPRQFMNQYFGPDPSQEWEKMGQKARSNLVDTSYEVVHNENDQVEDSYGQMENVDHAESIQEPSPHSSSDMDITYSRSSSLKRSKSCRSVMENISSPLSDKVVVAKSAANNEFEEELSVRESRSEGDIKKLSRQDSQTSVTSVEEKEMEQNDDIYALSPTSRTLQKVMNFDLKAVYEDYIGEDGTPRSIASVDIAKNNFGSNEEWSETFEKQRRKIIELWDECNIPLLHRTYFFLLIKGDPSDAVYIEVELRRLSFLKESVSHTTSARSLNRERAMLARKLLRKFTTKEREALFEKWNIDLDSRQRRMQLTQLIWSKINDIEHAKDSAEIVAKLVGLIEPNKTPKELFALSFAPKQESHNRLASWINPYL